MPSPPYRASLYSLILLIAAYDALLTEDLLRMVPSRCPFLAVPAFWANFSLPFARVQFCTSAVSDITTTPILLDKTTQANLLCKVLQAREFFLKLLLAYLYLKIMNCIFSTYSSGNALNCQEGDSKPIYEMLQPNTQAPIHDYLHELPVPGAYHEAWRYSSSIDSQAGFFRELYSQHEQPARTSLSLLKSSSSLVAKCTLCKFNPQAITIGTSTVDGTCVYCQSYRHTSDQIDHGKRTVAILERLAEADQDNPPAYGYDGANDDRGSEKDQGDSANNGREQWEDDGDCNMTPQKDQDANSEDDNSNKDNDNNMDDDSDTDDESDDSEDDAASNDDGDDNQNPSGSASDMRDRGQDIDSGYEADTDSFPTRRRHHRMPSEVTSATSGSVHQPIRHRRHFQSRITDIADEDSEPLRLNIERTNNGTDGNTSPNESHNVHAQFGAFFWPRPGYTGRNGAQYRGARTLDSPPISPTTVHPPRADRGRSPGLDGGLEVGESAQTPLPMSDRQAMPGQELQEDHESATDDALALPPPAMPSHSYETGVANGNEPSQSGINSTHHNYIAQSNTSQAQDRHGESTGRDPERLVYQPYDQYGRRNAWDWTNIPAAYPREGASSSQARDSHPESVDRNPERFVYQPYDQHGRRNAWDWTNIPTTHPREGAGSSQAQDSHGESANRDPEGFVYEPRDQHGRRNAWDWTNIPTTHPREGAGSSPPGASKPSAR